MRQSPLHYGLIALIGALVAAALAFTYQRAESARHRAQFDQLAQQEVLRAQQRIAIALDDLVSLGAFIEANNGTVTRRQFNRFCTPLLRGNHALQALEWIPRVAPGQRAAFEGAARADGLSGFRFSDRDAQGQLRPEGAQPVYYPVYYAEPMAGNARALGFDLRSNAARRAALEKSAATGAMVATSRIVLVQDPDGGYGFLLFSPVYASDGERRQLNGFVLGVFRVADLLQPPHGGADPAGAVPLAVFDRTDAPAGGAEVLFPVRDAPALARLRADGQVFESGMNVGGRDWLLVAHAPASGEPRLGAWIIAGLVGVFTLLVMALVRQTGISRENEAQRAVAQRAAAAKSQFLANVSHEIRTPLNGVIGMIDLLMQSSLNPAQMRMAEVSRRSAMALLTIINDLLDYAKIESGKFELVDDSVDIERLLRDVAEFFRPLALRSHSELSLFVDPRLPSEFIGDEARLRQVLTNLVSNAIKFSSGFERTGRVAVRAQRATAGDALEIVVSDNGIGIDEPTRQRLFTPFEQADASTTKRFGGTGLGLSISNHLVELMGGHIAVASEPGRGSVFTVRLPLRVGDDVASYASRDLAGIVCALHGPVTQLADDVAAYLRGAGASVIRGATPGRAEGEVKASIWCGAPDEAARGEFEVFLGGAEATATPGRVLGVRGVEGGDVGPVWLDAEQVDRRVLIDAVMRVSGLRAGSPFGAAAQGPAEAEASAAAALAPSPAAPAAAARVLVAEDNETNREVIRLQLERIGVYADYVDDGAQALRRWRDGDYVLLLTDLHMPELDGFELTRAIRREEAAGGRARIAIVAVTAAALPDELARTEQVGMDGHLTKPLDPALLREAVQRWAPPQAAPVASAPPVEVARPESAAAPATHLDLSLLKGLVGDDPALIDSLLAQYRDELERSLPGLDAALAASDAAAAGAVAHKLKSSSRTVGAAALAVVFEHLEQAGKGGQLDAARALLPELRAEVDAVREALPRQGG